MKIYLGLFLILFVLGCSDLASKKSSAAGKSESSESNAGSEESGKADKSDKTDTSTGRISTVVSYLKENYKSLQRKWLFNEVSSAGRSAGEIRAAQHSANVELVSDLSSKAKEALVAHAIKQVDTAVENMKDSDEAKAQKEIFKLALKTVFLKSIIEKPQDGQFSFYKKYKSELDENVENPLKKFESLIGDEIIGKMVESLSSEAPLSIDFKKEILSGLKENLEVVKPAALRLSDDAFRLLKFDVSSWLESQLKRSTLDLEGCKSQQQQPQGAPSFSQEFCSVLNGAAATISSYTTSINDFLSRGTPEFTAKNIDEDFKEAFAGFKTAYVTEDIAYLNYGIGTWLNPSSLKNIINDLKKKAKDADGDKAKDFVKTLEIFVEKMTRGHDHDPRVES